MARCGDPIQDCDQVKSMKNGIQNLYLGRRTALCGVLALAAILQQGCHYGTSTISVTTGPMRSPLARFFATNMKTPHSPEIAGYKLQNSDTGDDQVLVHQQTGVVV